jgi:indole-3-glycerol phosphate synthase
MTILDTIVEHKRMEVMKRKGRRSMDQLMEKPLYKREALKPKDYFNEGSPNIIAEFKRKSPSRGIISSIVSPVPVVESYKAAGAAAVSILTDRDFFGGDYRDLEDSKKRVSEIPLLRKDFMIDPFQVHEAMAYGADIILLIASILSKDEVNDLAGLATSLGLSVLLEVHDEEEIEKWNPHIAMVGVNNRDLKTFQTDVNKSFKLLPKLPAEAIKISESGLKNPTELIQLFEAGFQGFLMGERFMEKEDPGRALAEFMAQLKM